MESRPDPSIRAVIASYLPQPQPEEPPPNDTIQPSADGEPIFEPLNGAGATTEPALLTTITPSAWRGTPIPPMRWLALHRIPAGDVTILSGDGGGGKTTIALQLAVAVTQDLRILGIGLAPPAKPDPFFFSAPRSPRTKFAAASTASPETAASILTIWKTCICILQSLPDVL
jgi:AAA domain